MWVWPALSDDERHLPSDAGGLHAEGETGMALLAEAMNARPRNDAQMQSLFSDGFPPFITADREVPKYIGRIRSVFADLEIVLLGDGRIVAAAWGVPIRWSGDQADLPDGYTHTLRIALEHHDEGIEANTLVVMAAQVHPACRGRGIATAALDALRDVASARGWDKVIAPVRPTSKSLYPLIPIETFAVWVREDGLSVDPWIRTHQRMGGRIIATAPMSQTMTGSCAEWEAWTGVTGQVGWGSQALPSASCMSAW